MIAKSTETAKISLTRNLEEVIYMPDVELENNLLKKYRAVGGMDEAGRGPLAGPVVVACVVLKDPISIIAGINDSKLVTPAKREKLYEKIIENAYEYSIGEASHLEIDEHNILNATMLAMERAMNALNDKPEFVLVDGVFRKPFTFRSDCIIGGDRKHYSISAASILAKVYRDRLMVENDERYPGYDFAKHKGYGTKSHYEALNLLGPCEIHRRSFIRNLID